MHFDILDILSPDLPEELVSAFDVVHIRAFAVVVKGGDPGTVLERLCKMLSMLSTRSCRKYMHFLILSHSFEFNLCLIYYLYLEYGFQKFEYH